MTEPFTPETFDIFSGDTDRDALWRESVEGIDQARQRMRELAEKRPGSYFIFHVRTHGILDRICTAKSGDHVIFSDSAALNSA